MANPSDRNQFQSYVHSSCFMMAGSCTDYTSGAQTTAALYGPSMSLLRLAMNGRMLLEGAMGRNRVEGRGGTLTPPLVSKEGNHGDYMCWSSPSTHAESSKCIRHKTRICMEFVCQYSIVHSILQRLCLAEYTCPYMPSSVHEQQNAPLENQRAACRGCT